MLQYWLQILAEAAYWAHRCHLVKWRQEFLCHDWSNIEIPPWVCNPLVIAGHLGWVNYRQAENQQPVSPEGHKKKHLNLNRSQENLTRPWTTQVFFFFSFNFKVGRKGSKLAFNCLRSGSLLQVFPTMLNILSNGLLNSNFLYFVPRIRKCWCNQWGI